MRTVLMLAVGFLLGVLLHTLIHAQESPRLREIALEKKYQEERYERAKLEQTNAQYRFRELVAEEQRIRAEMKKTEGKGKEEKKAE